MKILKSSFILFENWNYDCSKFLGNESVTFF